MLFCLKVLIPTCRRDVIQPLSQQGGSEGCRVIAFDRPPYGLSERPMTWPEGPEGNPYTSEASFFCVSASSSCCIELVCYAKAFETALGVCSTFSSSLSLTMHCGAQQPFH